MIARFHRRFACTLPSPCATEDSTPCRGRSLCSAGTQSELAATSGRGTLRHRRHNQQPHRGGELVSIDSPTALLCPLLPCLFRTTVCASANMGRANVKAQLPCALSGFVSTQDRDTLQARRRAWLLSHDHVVAATQEYVVQRAWHAQPLPSCAGTLGRGVLPLPQLALKPAPHLSGAGRPWGQYTSATRQSAQWPSVWHACSTNLDLASFQVASLLLCVCVTLSSFCTPLDLDTLGVPRQA